MLDMIMAGEGAMPVERLEAVAARIGQRGLGDARRIAAVGQQEYAHVLRRPRRCVDPRYIAPVALERLAHAEAGAAGEVAIIAAIPGRIVVVGIVERVVELVRRSEEHTSELQSLMRISYAVFCL